MWTQADRAEPLDEVIAARVRDSFARQGMMRHMGAVMSEVARGFVRITLPYRAELTQQHGFFHGGATAAIADSAGGYAGLSVFPADSSVLTVEFKINLVAPAKGERLEAIGKVIKSGKTLTVCQLEVYAVAGDDETLIAVGQQTLIRLAGKPDAPA